MNLTLSFLFSASESRKSPYFLPCLSNLIFREEVCQQGPGNVDLNVTKSGLLWCLRVGLRNAPRDYAGIVRIS